MLGIWSPQGAVMFLHSLRMKSRKTRFARDVCDTIGTHFGLLDDVTDTDCWEQKVAQNIQVLNAQVGLSVLLGAVDKKIITTFNNADVQHNLSMYN